MSLNESINWLLNDVKEKDSKLENIKALVQSWEKRILKEEYAHSRSNLSFLLKEIIEVLK